MSSAVDAAVRRRWPNRGPAWSAALPAELQALCSELGVAPGRTFPARFAFVTAASSGSGARLVLRSTADPDAENQVAALSRLADLRIAPRLHGVHRTPTALWTVMDAVTPGTPLTTAQPEEWLSEHILATLRTLAADHAGPPCLPDLVPWIAERLNAPSACDLPPGRSPTSEIVRARARTALDALGPPPSERLCHGDLSPGNALIGQSRIWLIDPRGINGEVAYDVAVAALKSCNNDVEQAPPVAAALARAIGADPDRAAQWVSIAAAASV